MSKLTEGKRVYYIKNGLILNSFIKTKYKNQLALLRDGEIREELELFNTKQEAKAFMDSQSKKNE